MSRFRPSDERGGDHTFLAVLLCLTGAPIAGVWFSARILWRDVIEPPQRPPIAAHEAAKPKVEPPPKPEPPGVDI